VSKLLGFDFRIEFKPRTSNVVTDALSRHDTESSAVLLALSAPSFNLFDDLCHEIDADSSLRELRDAVATGARGDAWQVVDGLISVAGPIYISPTSPSLLAVLATSHGSSHEGVERTLHRLRTSFQVPGEGALVCDMPTQQRGAPSSCRPPPTAGDSVDNLGRHCHGFRRRFYTGEREICHTHGGGQILQICTLHPPPATPTRR
jgi:hypothetical protein